MSGAPPPQPGDLGTDDDPLDIESDVLELLNTTAGVATVENLVGVAADSTNTDGTLVYPTANGAQGVPTDLAVRIDGVDRPVTAIEYQTVTLDIGGVGQVDSQGVPLTGGQSSTTTLSWAVPSSQTEQDYTATVASADDTASQTVTVADLIPSPATHRWKLGDVATGTATDSIGSADGTVNGVSSISGTYQGGSAGDGDGTDDFINLTDLSGSGFDSNIPGKHAVSFTIKSSASPGIYPFGFSRGSFGEYGVNLGSVFDSPPQDAIKYWVGENSSNVYGVTFNKSVLDGGTHRICIVMRGTAAQDIECYVDASEVTNKTIDQDSGTPSVTFSKDLYLFAANYRTSGDDFHYTGVIDDLVLYDDELSSSEIQDDFNLQPWS